MTEQKLGEMKEHHISRVEEFPKSGGTVYATVSCSCGWRGTGHTAGEEHRHALMALADAIGMSLTFSFETHELD